MLRSLYSGISGLRAHQTMLDVTGNNIANVNTAGFKSSTVQFQDTLSQLMRSGAEARADVGGTNPAQVGLGVQVAGISTNFAQGSAQATGRSSDMMIAGEGFFVTSKGGEQLYARAGSFDFDSQGRLVSPDGALLQGWAAVNGQVNVGAGLSTITINKGVVVPAVETTTAKVGGNLPQDAVAGTVLTRDVRVFDANGAARSIPLTFSSTGAGWYVFGTDPNGPTGSTSLSFVDGAADPGHSLAIGGITVDLSTVTGYAEMSTIAVVGKNGNAAGTLDSFTMGNDGTLTGTFSNGEDVVIGRVALANFTNAAGLEKTGASTYRATAFSGAATVGTAGTNGLGSLSNGYVEMSNVDLSQEFTNLIVAQRGFQSNARIITTSDEVLQELTQLKR